MFFIEKKFMRYFRVREASRDAITAHSNVVGRNLYYIVGKKFYFYYVAGKKLYFYNRRAGNFII